MSHHGMMTLGLPLWRTIKQTNARPDEYGRTCAITGLTAAPRRRQPYTMRRATAAASIRRSTWPGIAAFCRVIVTMVSSRSVSPERKRYRSPSSFFHAHARRKFFALAGIQKSARDRKRKGKPISPLVLEAVQRYDALERDINGLSAAERLAARQEKSKPLFDDKHAWLKRERATLSKSSEVIEPIDYTVPQ